MKGLLRGWLQILVSVAGWGSGGVLARGSFGCYELKCLGGGEFCIKARLIILRDAGVLKGMVSTEG